MKRILLALVLALSGLSARADPKIGVVIMHGKGGSPTKYVADLASALKDKGYLVANLEMPWSGRRNYDVGTAAAQQEVASALAALKAKGAQKLFVAGHSMGGLFALHLGGTLALDGVIAIAPGGNAASPLFRRKLGDSLARARQLVAEGKGNQTARLEDFEGSHGTYPVVAVPAAYVTWFDPDGAMNEMRAARSVNPHTPVLWIAPEHDYPGLRRIAPKMYAALPANPLTQMYKPDSDHLGAPTASIDEIVRWTKEVAAH